MPTSIYAIVYRDNFAPSHPQPWIASAMAVDTGRVLQVQTLRAHSWPEAMQLAYKLRAEVDTELMNEVHASRARRRTAAVECPHGRLLICHDCQDEANNTHTMEATA